MPYNSERVPLKNRTQVCFDRFLHVSRPFAQVAIPAVSKVSLNAELFNTHNARNGLSLASEHSCHSCASHGTEDMQRWFILIVISVVPLRFYRGRHRHCGSHQKPTHSGDSDPSRCYDAPSGKIPLPI